MQQHTTTRDDLVAAAISGDRRAITSLWERHRRWIAAVLLAHKPSEADVEDLLQEVAMRLVSRVSTLREESNIRAWLRAVAVNVARSAARRRPIRSVELDEGGVAALGPDELEQAERTGRLMDRLRELPVLYREPLMLRAVHGMRTRQIADILELPPATIDTRIARARRMLRDGIEDLPPAPEGGPDHSAEAPR